MDVMQSVPEGGGRRCLVAPRWLLRAAPWRSSCSPWAWQSGNEKELRELPEHVREEMAFVFAERIEEVCAAAIPARATRRTSTAAA